MKIDHVPLSKLTLGHDGVFANPRSRVVKKEIRELADSIEGHGLQYPLRCIKHGDTVIVVDGGRRLRAIQLLVDERRAGSLDVKIPVTFIGSKDSTETDLRIDALVSGLQRKDLSSYEIAQELANLYESGMQQAIIASTLGKSQSWVSRLLSCWTKTSDNVRQSWQAGKLPDDDVQALAKLPEKTQDGRLAKLMKHRDAAKQAKPGAVRKSKSAARAITKSTKTSRSKNNADDNSELVTTVATATKNAVKSHRYVKGMHDMCRLILGEIAIGDLDREFKAHAEKSSNGKRRRKRSHSEPLDRN